MSDTGLTRRAILRRSVATVGAGAIASTAGCGGLNPLGGGGPYIEWLPAPDELDEDHYGFFYFDMDAIESTEDQFDDDSFDPESFQQAWDPVSVDWEDTSMVLSLASNIVVEADFDRGSVAEDLEDADYDDDTDHEGYTIFLGPAELRAFAVSDSDIVVTGGGYNPGDPVDIAEVIIDATTGNVARYADENEDMSTLVGELGAGTFVSGSTREQPETASPGNGVFDDMVASGSTTEVNGDTADETWVVVYDTADDVDTGDLEDWVDENSDDGEFADVDDISYTQNGRMGIITGTIDTDDI